MPRNAGGTDGPDVSLCSEHHGTIHKIASRLHRKASHSELLSGENPAWIKKLMWLAVCIVRAEKATEGDPNKQYHNGISLRPEEIEMIKRLQTVFPGKGRSELIRASLFYFYKKNFPNV